MFRRRRHKSIQITRLSSLISENLEIVGDVLFSGGLRIDGRVQGNVIGKDGERSLLVLSDKGSIAGRVQAHDAVINGEIRGDVEIEHFLELQDNARVSGNIGYRQLQMDCGAVVAGKLVKTDEASQEAGEIDAPAQGSKVIDITAANPAAGGDRGAI